MNINFGIDKEIITESLYITNNDNKTPKYGSLAFLIDSSFNKNLKENNDNLQLPIKKNKVDYNTTNSFFDINNIIELGNKEISKFSEETNHKELNNTTDSSALEFNNIKPIIHDESSSLGSSIQKNDELVQKQDSSFDVSKYGERKEIGEKNTIHDESSSLESSIQKNDELIQEKDLFFDISRYGKRKAIGEKNTIHDESSSLGSSIQKNDELVQKQDSSFDVSKYGERKEIGEKNTIHDESSSLERSIQKNDEFIQEKDLFFDNAITTKREIFLLDRNKDKIDNFSELQQQKLYDNTLIISNRNDNSIKLVLEPDGIGELNIEISQNEGAINAQFDVVETIGKELLEKNLNDILYSLIEGGVSIGNFSISLKDKRYRDKIKKNISDDNTREEKITENINRVISHKNDGNISIFV